MRDNRAYHALLLLLGLSWLGSCETGGRRFRADAENYDRVRMFNALNQAAAQEPMPPTPAPEPEPEPDIFILPRIVVPERVGVGQPIKAALEFKAPEGARVRVWWEADAAYEEYGQWLLYLWAKPGRHTLAALVVLVTDTDIQHWRVSAEFVVGDAPAPGPQPAPTLSLADLVPDPAHRKQLATFYGDLAGVVRANGFATTSHFRAGAVEAVRIAQAAGALPTGLGKLNRPISDRLAAAIGLDDAPLDGVRTTKLAAALEAIAAEFGGK